MIERVSYTSTDGIRLGAWLRLPSGPIRSAVVVAHGYGGAQEPAMEWVPDDAAALFPIARGLPTLSLNATIPALSHDHVLHGISSRDSYVHGGCAADFWCSISAFEELLGTRLGEKHGGLRLGFFGPSFGGGIGAMLVPWDDRIDAASLYVPSFGSNRQRLAAPCIGSGAAVRQWVTAHPEAWKVLDYFDAATSARRIAVPTIVAAAKDDPAVPPVGQFAIASAIPDEFRHLRVMTAGHREYEGEAEEMSAYARATRELFTGR